jgi:hypothetical protein
MGSDNTKVRIHTKLEGLIKDWSALSTSKNGPTQHFIWSKACAETFKAAGKLQIVSVDFGDHPAALAPPGPS